MSFYRCFQADLHRAIASPRFCIAVIGYAVLLCINLPTNPWPEDAVYLFSLSYKYGFYIFFFLCAAIPYATSYLSDIDNNYLQSILKRVSIKTYSVSKCLSVMLSGMLAITLATLIFLLFLGIRYPTQEAFPQSYSGWDRLISDGNLFFYYAVKTGMTAMIGGSFAVIALTISTIIRNSFVVLAIPTLLYYALNEIAIIAEFPIACNIGAFLYVPVFENSFDLSLLYLLSISTFLFISATLLFYVQVGRMRKNGCCA